MSIKLKVCGMRNAENIKQLAGIGPDYVGFIFYEGSKRYAESLEESALEMLPPSVKKTGVFVDASYDTIMKLVDKYRLSAIQLHGNESATFCGNFRKNDLEVIKAFGIDKEFIFSKLSAYKTSIHYFLFDTKTEQHGGSGKSFDWELLKEYDLETPYFLSGGLDIGHSKEILKISDPRLYALDLNSRFEIEPGLKDIKKLKSFFNAIRIPA